MTHGQPEDPNEPSRTPRRVWVSRAVFRSKVSARRADIERQVLLTRAQLDATNERIEARAGRNLILAIAIGLVFGLLMLFSLIFIKDLFLAVGAVAIGFASLELASALRVTGRNVPRIPIVIAALAIVPAAFYFGAGLQWLTALGGIGLVVIWRLIEVVFSKQHVEAGTILRDVVASILVLAYVPFLGSFAVLLTAGEGGQWWTLAFIVLVVATDTGAYAAGLSFGKHPMAPTISPKKTWEGFAGAAAASIIAGILLAIFMLSQPWWFGVIFGVVMLGTATFGDLAESLIKRDIGVKDMSSWLPGHGGFLDRLDSILPSAFAAYVLYLVFS